MGRFWHGVSGDELGLRVLLVGLIESLSIWRPAPYWRMMALRRGGGGLAPGMGAGAVHGKWSLASHGGLATEGVLVLVWPASIQGCLSRRGIELVLLLRDGGPKMDHSAGGVGL